MLRSSKQACALLHVWLLSMWKRRRRSSLSKCSMIITSVRFSSSAAIAQLHNCTLYVFTIHTCHDPQNSIQHLDRQWVNELETSSGSSHTGWWIHMAYGFAMDFLQFYGSLSSNLVLLSWGFSRSPGDLRLCRLLLNLCAAFPPPRALPWLLPGWESTAYLPNHPPRPEIRKNKILRSPSPYPSSKKKLSNSPILNCTLPFPLPATTPGTHVLTFTTKTKTSTRAA
jgi:hypothetical protein